MSKDSKMNILTRGLVIENPVLRLALGTCPTLAISTSLQSALGMGLAATLVLICSNMVISSLRKVIPDQVRIPAFITIIASFVTIIQMLIKGFLPDIDAQLGVYLPLIVVNCIILGRAEAFASQNPVLLSALDGLGMGIGFTVALSSMGIIREFFGAGAFFNTRIWPESIPVIVIFILPPGGFFVFGCLIAACNKLAKRHGLAPMTLNCCAGCSSSKCPSKTLAKTAKKPASSSKKDVADTSSVDTADKIKKAATAKPAAPAGGEAPKKTSPEPTKTEEKLDDRPYADVLEKLKEDEFKRVNLTEIPENPGPASSYDSVLETAKTRAEQYADDRPESRPKSYDEDAESTETEPPQDSPKEDK